MQSFTAGRAPTRSSHRRTCAQAGDRASFVEPTASPTGVSQVLVNGVIVLDGGVHTGARPGRVLRGGCAEGRP